MLSLLSPTICRRANNYSQSKVWKTYHGRVDQTTYAPDSKATAVILGKLTMSATNGDLKASCLVSEYKVKIKVLKPEGTSYANVTIPYYELANNTMKENIIGLDASAYNMENGKMVRTKMKKDMVFKERLNENQMTLKFSIRK